MAVGDGGLRIVDLCSGSGVLAIALARAIPHATVEAVEVSDEALPYLVQNVADLAPEVVITHGSLESFASGVAPSSLDLIVSNPPYIALDEMAGLAPELDYEPRMALTDEQDGLSAYRAITQDAMHHLNPRGR